MFKSIVFPTKSRYEGFWNPSNRTMDGFGSYTFPDGSIYQGYFQNGHFQGSGTLKLLFPQKVTIKANFDKGKCVKIIQLVFGDGLEFFGSFGKDGTLDANKWDYCSKYDRRYFNETFTGLHPPGRHAYLTANRRARSLNNGTYDTSDGIFYPCTGFITFTENNGEKSKHRFVGCPKDREYIQKHYRLSKVIDVSYIPIEPSAELSQQIIECNIASMCHHYESTLCRCEKKAERDRYYNNLCAKHVRADDKVEDKAEMSRSDINMTISSSSIESFDHLREDPCQQDTVLQDQQEKDEGHITVDDIEKRHNAFLLRQKEGVRNITKFSIVSS